MLYFCYDTCTQVTLRMYGKGPKQRTPKVVLSKPSARFMFMRESTNTFGLTANDFPEISAIEIEVSVCHAASHGCVDAAVCECQPFSLPVAERVMTETCQRLS